MAARSRSKSGKARRQPKGGGRAIPFAAASPEAQAEALAARLSQERLEAFTAALRPADGNPAVPDIRALHEIVRGSFALFDSLHDDLILDPPLACKQGCIHCCWNQVALTEPEALYLGLHLLDTRTPERLRELAAKAEGLVDGLKGKSWREIGMARHRLPCLFLENGNCSVYPARPLACRGWNSVNAAMCLESNLTEDALTPIENHPILRLMADSIQDGLLRGSRSMALEAGYLLMARATHLLLRDDPAATILACAESWLLGQPLFGRKRDW
ncbi:YkgJ family cysteine cluster protein [Pseudodesulfovibrio indicus]|uniref:YkgJ family cysteine cluster protein n=1 Tax=Pseudodesulfovibrio indicus TaxID=1716143 RepID=UPI002931374F|nr:YkgJ family cysteine cluster protein [Pseudodesulfovibrio indicus]